MKSTCGDSQCQPVSAGQAGGGRARTCPFTLVHGHVRGSQKRGGRIQDHMSYLFGIGSQESLHILDYHMDILGYLLAILPPLGPRGPEGEAQDSPKRDPRESQGRPKEAQEDPGPVYPALIAHRGAQDRI